MVRRLLWNGGARYRLQYKTPCGRADLAFPAAKVAVFVDGCFWHGCPEHYVPPRTRREFWQQKLAGNVSRDREQTQQLEVSGWRVLRFWEHEVFVQPEVVVDIITRELSGGPVRQRVQKRVHHVAFLDPDGVMEERFFLPLRGDQDLPSEVRERRTSKW